MIYILKLNCSTEKNNLSYYKYSIIPTYNANILKQITAMVNEGSMGKWPVVVWVRV